MKQLIAIVLSVLSLGGCGAASLQSKPDIVSTLPKGQGVIVGSVVVKTQNASALFPVKLSGKEWHVFVRPVGEGLLSKIFPPQGKFLDVTADGNEVPFVSVLPAGRYMIDDMFTTSGFDPNFDLPLKLRFTIPENAKTYLGRLVITMPSQVNMFKTLIIADHNISVEIEDAEADTVAQLSTEYGNGFAENLQKALLTVR